VELKTVQGELPVQEGSAVGYQFQVIQRRHGSRFCATSAAGFIEF